MKKKIIIYGLKSSISVHIQNRNERFLLDGSATTKEENDFKVKEELAKGIPNHERMSDHIYLFIDYLWNNRDRNNLVDYLNNESSGLYKPHELEQVKGTLSEDLYNMTHTHQRFKVKYMVAQAKRDWVYYENKPPEYNRYEWNFENFLMLNYEDYMTKNSCKQGLELAKINKNIEIYFVLDGINMERVVHKKREDITGSELRYVYRNYEAYGDNLKFLNNNKQVDAPWITNPKLWEEYTPKKSLNQVIKKAQVVCQNDIKNKKVEKGYEVHNRC